MQKYRIINQSRHDLTNITFHVQRKGFWGWRMIKVTENGDSKHLSFGSYVEAEHYIVKNYFRDGHLYQPTPNEYHYTQATYYY